MTGVQYPAPVQREKPAGTLDQAIWPGSAVRNSAGALEIGGVDCRDLVAQYQSPVYVLDEADARSRAQGFRDAYESAGAATVYYAAKAFLATAVAKWVTEAGLGIDVASGGELEVVLRAGVPGDQILMHGNNKSMAEIELALTAGVGRIVVDSFDEIVRLADAAGRLGIVQQVLVRVTVGVEAHTHEFIATAHEDQKFGLSVASGDAAEAVRRIAKLPALAFAGLHSHLGSQIFDAAGFNEAAARVAAFTRSLRDEQGVIVRELNLGGGMGIAYVDGDDPLGNQQDHQHKGAGQQYFEQEGTGHVDISVVVRIGA